MRAAAGEPPSAGGTSSRLVDGAAWLAGEATGGGEGAPSLVDGGAPLVGEAVSHQGDASPFGGAALRPERTSADERRPASSEEAARTSRRAMRTKHADARASHADAPRSHADARTSSADPPMSDADGATNDADASSKDADVRFRRACARSSKSVAANARAGRAPSVRASASSARMPSTTRASVSFEPHLDRARAESFGSYADAYDRHRLPFPTGLVDDLVALAPKRVLDAACGTGLVARALAARGLSVLGVELDPRMAEIARRHGVDVEVARFEEWQDAGRRFNLVTFGDAWHWIDPDKGIAKVASILEPGGMLVRFFKGYVLAPETFAKIEPIYRAIAPGLRVYGKWPDDVEWVDPVASSAELVMRPAKEYASDEVFATSQWTGYLSTASDHHRLAPDVLARLLDAVGEALGPEVAVRARTIALFAQRSLVAT